MIEDGVNCRSKECALPIGQIGPFRVEIVVISTPRGVYGAGLTHKRISELLLRTFLDRGIDARLIDPGGRGATGDAAFKMVPLLVRLVAYWWKKYRRTKELEFSDETGWRVIVELQAFILRGSRRTTIHATTEMLDVLKLAEQRIRESFGPDIFICGNVATFDKDTLQNLGSVTVDPGVLEDSSRLWAGRAFENVPEGKLVNIRRRPYLRTPKLLVVSDEPNPVNPSIDASVARRRAGFDPEISSPGLPLDGGRG